MVALRPLEPPSRVSGRVRPSPVSPATESLIPSKLPRPTAGATRIDKSLKVDILDGLSIPS